MKTHLLKSLVLPLCAVICRSNGNEKQAVKEYEYIKKGMACSPIEKTNSKLKPGVTSKTNCQNFCTKIKKCYGYDYNKNSKKCYILKYTSFSPVITKSKNNWCAAVKISNGFCPVPNFSKFEEWVTNSSNLRGAAQSHFFSSVVAVDDTTKRAEVCIETDPMKRKVLLIGVDGLRADAAAMLPLPNIRRLERMGSYSYWATIHSTGVALSGPGWASLFTAVEPSKHNVDGNDDLQDISSSFPTVFKRVKENFGSKKIAASVSWHPLIKEMINSEDGSSLDAKYLAANDDSMTNTAKEWILDADGETAYDFILVDFEHCDKVGHLHGFDGYSDEYMQAVTDTDTRIGTLIDAVLEASTGADEEWLIILTSTHGGRGTTHGAFGNYDHRVPLLVASNSPRVNIGNAPSKDPGSHMDVLPTIISFFGGPKYVIPEEWDLDGQVFGFLDYERLPPSQCIPDRATCGCADKNQADYRGATSVTKTGKVCQRWDSESPHEHDRTSDNYPTSGLAGNYCRNPDGEDSSWCYTMDPDDRWDYCNILYCPFS